MKYLILIYIAMISISPLILNSQVYKDVYSNGIYMLSNEDDPASLVKWVSPTINSTVTFTLPPNFGNAGYAMTSLGNGTLTWTDISQVVGASAGSTGQIQFNNSGVFGASSKLYWNKNNLRLGVGTSSPSFSIDATKSIGVNLDNTNGGIALYSEQGVTDYTYYITAPANLTSSLTFTWPSNFTAANQVITTTGNGNLSWSTSWAGTNGDCVGQGVEPSTTGNNTASGGDSFIGGGTNNAVTGTGTNGFIGGGTNNTVSGSNSGILAGQYNSVGSSASNSAIGGGRYNSMNGSYCIIYAGEYNSIGTNAQSSLIGGGRYNYIDSKYSVIGAGESNTISSGSDYSYIGAGKTNNIKSNSPFSAIQAGQNNTIESSKSFSTIGAGNTNKINASYSFIGSGGYNNISGSYSTILGGESNTISGNYSFIAGGLSNTASGNYAIALGRNADATGSYSVAFGRDANALHNGSFVFADGNSGGLSSSTINQMTMRFTNEITMYSNSGKSQGVRLTSGQSSWSSISDRNLKTDILNLNPTKVLEKISELNVFSWAYKGYGDEGIRNYGPMAQDFYTLFGTDKYGHIGTDKTISSIHLSSIGIVGVQALKDLVLKNNIKIA